MNIIELYKYECEFKFLDLRIQWIDLIPLIKE
jgi:hypothetical protein